MSTLPNLDEIQNLLSQAQEILILTHEKPTQDSLAASLSFYLSLQQANKRVSVSCSTPSTVEFSHLVGIDKVSDSLGGKNFVISLDYVEGSIEKVSYNIENGKFNLVIEPKAGAPSFSPEKVHYSSGTPNPDLIILLDCVNFEQLGKFYQDDKEMYSKVTTLNIDYHPENQQFAKINLVNPGASSTSEIVAFLLQNLGLPINEDIATNLLSGIDFATSNFSSPQTSAGAFEAAVICLKVGGKRKAAFVTSTSDSGEPMEAPPDWLQPKIFKSGSPRQPMPPKDESTLI